MSDHLEFSECYAPWYAMRLFPEKDGMVGPCCHFCPPSAAFLAPLKDERSIADAWNSEQFQTLRKDIANNTPRAQPCIEHCFQSHASRHDGNEYEQLWRDGKLKLAGVQRENVILAFAEYAERKHILTALPIHYYIRYGWNCNVNCIMCNHAEMQRSLPEEINIEWLKMQEEYFRRAILISLIGGEPLAGKYLDMTRWFLSHESFEQTAFFLITNGVNLDKLSLREVDKLSGVKVSIDSSDRYYEMVRVGSSWNRVSKNVESFVKRKREHVSGNGLIQYPVKIDCTMTNTGLPGIPNLIRWVVDLGCMLRFHQIKVMWQKPVMHESLENVDELVRRNPNWRDILLECIEIAEQKSKHFFGAHQLRELLENLDKAIAER